MSDQSSPIAPGRAEWVPLSPEELEAIRYSLPKPPGRHMTRGEPSAVYTYLDASRMVLGYVCRFKRTKHVGHEMLPLTFCTHLASGDRAWRWMQFPEPRPLYRLDDNPIFDFPKLAEKPVLVCTDEPQVDFARVHLHHEFWCTTWPGGPKLFKKADWEWVRGRKVFILPDGTTTPAALAQHLVEIAAAVEVARPKEQIPPGWDPAEAFLQGWDLHDMTTFALMPAPKKPPTPPATPAGPSGPQKPGDGDWRIGLLYADSGKLIDCRENVIMILQRHPAWQDVIGLDEFANRVMIRQAPPDVDGFEPGEWGIEHDVSLGLWFAQQEDRMLKMIVKSTDTISQGVNYVATKNRFNPVRDYMDSLDWDGVDRLDKWLSDFLGVDDTVYASLVGRYFMLGMIARVYEPGCQMRLVLVLEGDQWKGKSTALRTLGGAWFSDSKLDLNSKEAYLSIQGKLLNEIPEFDSFSRHDFNSVKAFISSTSDFYRPPYDRRSQDFPRQGVFAATVNQDEYFKDPTGNTRFAPVRTTDINIPGLAEMRDQLLAEAVAKYKRGDRQYPTREELDVHFKPEQDDREIMDPWIEIIGDWFSANPGTTKITIPEILAECLKIERGKIDGARSMSIRVGTALKRHGWRKAGRKSNNGPRVYVRPSASPVSTPEASVEKPF